MGARTGPRVEILCGQADDEALTQRAARYGVADVLARVVADAAAGEVSEADLDALDNAFALHGIDNLTRASRTFQPWPGARDVTVTAWVCPTGACTRARAATAGNRPVCGLTGMPLTETRIRL
jgi:hypothetical protein